MGSIDRRMAALAARQHGLLTAPQLVALGITGDQLQWRLDQGRLVAVHRGVYRMPGIPTFFEQEVLAACLASGGYASHRSAARLFGLRGFTSEGLIEITVEGDRRARLAGVTCHRSSALATTTIGVIPVTMPSQILLDVAGVAPGRAEGAFSDALLRNLVHLPGMVRFLNERGASGRPGVVALRRLVEAFVKGGRPTESWLEDRLVEFLRRFGLPEPDRQYPLDVPGYDRGIRFDFAFPWCRGAVEADGRLWHLSPSEIRRDQERDAAAQRAGWSVERVTWLQLVETPGDVLARLHRLLGATQAA
jgi:hypothetical protein